MTFELRPSTFELRVPRRRGLSALLVLVALAVGAILGWAMLANAAIQAQVSGNAAAGLAAEGTAESGLNLGVYYLLHPELAPSLDDSKTYYSGGSNISLGTGAAGTLNSLTIARDPIQTSQYIVSAQASANGGRGNVLVRSSSLRCTLNTEYQVRYALATRSALTLPGSGLRVTVNGDARGDNNLLVNSPSSVTGTLYAQGSNLTTNWQPTPAFPSAATPAYSEINLTKSLLTYVYQGRVCTADQMLLDYNGGTMTTLAMILNPANVFVATGNRTISGNTVLNGTLIVPPSCTYLRINGNLRITPKPGMPALIVGQNLQINGNNRVVRLDGLTWIGSGISSAMGSINGTDIQIYGALMFGGSAPVLDSRVGGTLVINFTPDNLNVPNLCNQYRYPVSARILSYGN